MSDEVGVAGNAAGGRSVGELERETVVESPKLSAY